MNLKCINSNNKPFLHKYHNSAQLQTSKNLSFSCNSLAKKTGDLFHKASKNTDLQTNIAYAGKGIVTPLFIVFNPFTDKDRKERAYSALLTPILIGADFVAKEVCLRGKNKILNHLAEKGKLGKDLKPSKPIKTLAKQTKNFKDEMMKNLNKHDQKAIKLLNEHKEVYDKYFIPIFLAIPLGTLLYTKLFPPIMNKLFPNLSKSDKKQTDEIEKIIAKSRSMYTEKLKKHEKASKYLDFKSKEKNASEQLSIKQQFKLFQTVQRFSHC